MKKFTLLMSALMLAAGAFADVPEDAIILAVGNPIARDHGKYLAVTAEGRLITTNTIDNNSLWVKGYDEINWDLTLSNVGVQGYLYQGNQQRNITLSPTPVPLAQVDSEVLPGACGFSTKLDAKPNEHVFLNALNTDGDNETGGVGIWNLDEGSSFYMLDYDPNETEEQVAAKVTDLYNLDKAKVTAMQAVNPYLNASYYGRKVGDGALINIDWAETAEEVQQAQHSAMQSAVQYAERSLSDGSTLFNVRMQQTVSYTGNENTPFERVQSPDLNGLWVAEFVKAENEDETTDITVDDYTFKSFYLRNTVSGKYIGKTKNAGGAIVAADSKEEAGTLNLVIGSTGFELVINNNGNDNQYLNVSDNGTDSKLTIWTQANDAGAFFEFNELPVYTQGVLPTFVGVGETENDELRTLTAIDVCLPVGATPTGVGTIAVVLNEFAEDYTYVKTEIASWTGEDLLKLTSEVKTIESIGTEAQVYTLTFPETITKVGAYVTSASPYMFSLTADESTTFINSFAKTIEVSEPKSTAPITVTPAAGKVESISVIAIDPDSDGYWGVGESTGYVTVTFNGELATDTDGNELRIDADTMMFDYDAFDYNTSEGSGWEIPVDFTAEGKYVLTIPAGFFENMDEGINEETIVEWTIGEQSGIKEITSLKINGRAYDLNGRQVANPAHGLFIINGKKVIK